MLLKCSHLVQSSLIIIDPGTVCLLYSMKAQLTVGMSIATASVYVLWIIPT